MTFRKNSILFIEHMVIYCLLAVTCIALLPIDQIGALPYLSLLFVILIALNPFIHNEFVTVNEDGIVCRKKGKQIWKYNWDEIVKLQKSSRYRMPSVEIIIDNNICNAVSYDSSQHYFQFGRTARKAIAQYYQSGDNIRF